METARRGDTGLEAIRRQRSRPAPARPDAARDRRPRADPPAQAGDRDLAGLPIVMLTARGEEVDRIVGLELGADDYISKPFSPREVVLRVKAVLRRLQPEEAEAATGSRSGGIQLDIAGHQLRVRGKEMPLTATEFRLLRLLMERGGRVQTRGQLLSDVWGYAEDIDSRTVDTHIRRLRRKLGARGRPHRDGHRRRLPAEALSATPGLPPKLRLAPALARAGRRAHRDRPARVAAPRACSSAPPPSSSSTCCDILAPIRARAARATPICSLECLGRCQLAADSGIRITLDPPRRRGPRRQLGRARAGPSDGEPPRPPGGACRPGQRPRDRTCAGAPPPATPTSTSPAPSPVAGGRGDGPPPRRAARAVERPARPPRGGHGARRSGRRGRHPLHLALARPPPLPARSRA